jgi:hypothetical protein
MVVFAELECRYVACSSLLSEYGLSVFFERQNHLICLEQVRESIRCLKNISPCLSGDDALNVHLLDIAWCKCVKVFLVEMNGSFT